jgi:hypothetical protein
MDFSGVGEPLVDRFGNGTAIASVVAGEHDTTGLLRSGRRA